MTARVIGCLVITLFICAGQASARNTEHLLSIQDALSSGLGKSKLLDIPVYFGNQKHPAVNKKIGSRSTNKSTRGLFREDAQACETAFLSAVIQLQKRAQTDGANAVIGIESITMNKPHTSATEYRCVAGSMVVRVGLKGNLVQLSR